MGALAARIDYEEERFLRALTDEFDPLWWEVRMNSNSSATYAQVARNLLESGMIVKDKERLVLRLTKEGLNVLQALDESRIRQ